jgi:hypothetical protein
MSWPALLVTFGSIFAMACGGSTPTNSAPPPPNTIEMTPGQTLQVGALQVRFVSVAGDSRCPIDVLCVWAGDAIVRVELSEPPGTAVPHDLHTLNLQPAVHGGYQVDLVRLDPLPRSNEPIHPQDYRLFVRVGPVN